MRKYLLHIRLTAEALGVDPSMLVEAETCKGVISIMSTVTGAIVAKYRISNGTLNLTGHPAQ